jgi:hypothetical protein
MIRIQWAKVHSSILERTKEDLVVVYFNGTLVGPLFFEIDPDEEVVEVLKEEKIKELISLKDLEDRIVSFYNKHNTKTHESDESTIRHWFKINFK